MATKKDIAGLKTSISQINQAIGEIRDSVIKALLKENNALKERIKSLEIEASLMQQYQRRLNIVISGIAADVSGEMIEEKVIDVLRKVDVVVTPRDIEAVHRLGGNGKKTIVRFLNHKNAVAAVSSRAALNAKIGYMGKKIKRKCFIFSTWMRNGQYLLRRKSEINLNHKKLINSYPDFDFS